MFDFSCDTVDYSEDIDRSQMSEATIRKYLYEKLRRASVTIILLTPQAVNHKKNWFGEYDDWMYDEIRYSLEDRGYNRTNGLVAVYMPEAESMLVDRNFDGSLTVKKVDNLFRKNMMNVYERYKVNHKPGVYDRDLDSYCSLISWDDFTNNLEYYIDLAAKKREKLNQYKICKRL